MSLQGTTSKKSKKGSTKIICPGQEPEKGQTEIVLQLWSPYFPLFLVVWNMVRVTMGSNILSELSVENSWATKGMKQGKWWQFARTSYSYITLMKTLSPSSGPYCSLHDQEEEIPRFPVLQLSENQKTAYFPGKDSWYSCTIQRSRTYQHNT